MTFQWFNQHISGSVFRVKKGFKLQMQASGTPMNASDNKQYGAPTLKMLNPELFKEIEKQEKQMKDPIFVAVRNLKERYGYHEMRVQRI